MTSMDALLLKEAEKHGMYVEEVDGTRTTISRSTTKVAFQSIITFLHDSILYLIINLS